MPWYKTGTVSVTQNSNAVIGSGTAFIANSRVGDGFRGPDGRWYEVTNIASNTALSISPNYEGPTVAGGFYAIMPVQGYQKDLADQVRAILNDYGEKLAALGTTGNYDVLPVIKGGTGGTDPAAARSSLGLGSVATENVNPVAKGGTGGTDQASARTGLGLGSVATESVVPVSKGGTGGITQSAARTGLGLGTAAVATMTTSTADATPGRVLKVGDFGWGGPSLAESTWNNTNNTGFSNQPQAIGGPITGSAGWYANGINILYGSDTRIKTQIAIQVNGPGLATRNLQMDLSSATPWVYFWNTGNTTVDGSGFIKKASPIVRISDPSNTTRDDLLDGFTVAGYGAVNDEARGVVVERLELGRYRISGSLGLAVDGWQVNSPSDRNGGKLLGLAAGENQSDGSIIVEFRKVKYRLTDDGDLEQIPGPLIEAPLDNWIDVRLEMPPAAPYVPPPPLEDDGAGEIEPTI